MSTGRRLAATVYLYDDQGRPHVLRPSDEVPGWAAARITNPSAWRDEPVTGPSTPASPAPRTPSPMRPTPPPRGGKGSGAPAWREYARQLQVSVPDGADRDDIIAAVDRAGHPVD